MDDIVSTPGPQVYNEHLISRVPWSASMAYKTIFKGITLHAAAAWKQTSWDVVSLKYRYMYMHLRTWVMIITYNLRSITSVWVIMKPSWLIMSMQLCTLLYKVYLHCNLHIASFPGSPLAWHEFIIVAHGGEDGKFFGNEANLQKFSDFKRLTEGGN